jgi:hypothetical protein
LAKIRPELARGIAALEYRPQMREEMLEAAARIEENYKAERLEEETQSKSSKFKTSETTKSQSQQASLATKPQGTSGRGGRNSKFPKLEATTRAPVGATPATSPNDVPTGTSNPTPSHIVCYGCGKKGHYKSKCPEVVVRTATTKEAAMDDPPASAQGKQERRSGKGKG